MALLIHLPSDLNERLKALLAKRKLSTAQFRLSPKELAEARGIAQRKGVNEANRFIKEKRTAAGLEKPTQERLVLEIIDAGLTVLEKGV